MFFLSGMFGHSLFCEISEFPAAVLSVQNFFFFVCLVGSPLVLGNFVVKLTHLIPAYFIFITTSPTLTKTL